MKIFTLIFVKSAIFSLQRWCTFHSPSINDQKHPKDSSSSWSFLSIFGVVFMVHFCYVFSFRIIYQLFYTFLIFNSLERKWAGKKKYGVVLETTRYSKNSFSSSFLLPFRPTIVLKSIIFCLCIFTAFSVNYFVFPENISTPVRLLWVYTCHLISQ